MSVDITRAPYRQIKFDSKIILKTLTHCFLLFGVDGPGWGSSSSLSLDDITITKYNTTISRQVIIIVVIIIIIVISNSSHSNCYIINKQTFSFFRIHSCSCSVMRTTKQWRSCSPLMTINWQLQAGYWCQDRLGLICTKALGQLNASWCCFHVGWSKLKNTLSSNTCIIYITITAMLQQLYHHNTLTQ